MFQFPLYIFLLIYLGIVLISAIIFYISYHHIHSTGTLKGGALFTTLILGGLFILVLSVTLLSLTTTNWVEPISLGSSNLFEGISLFPQ
jgi:hypothetical protein